MNDLPGLSPNELKNITVSMNESATSMFRLLENLLEWSRIGQGLIPFSPETVSLRPLLIESLTSVKELARIKEIEITNTIPEDLTVFADGNILKTIFRNLVSNAIKFTPRGGNIHLSAKNTFENCVEISVKDSGIGMDPGIIGNLFRIDSRTGREGTEGEPSTGLGLILCKEFVEKHGGKIWAESIAGNGSTFYFTLNHRHAE